MTSEERLPWFPCEPGPLLGALAQMPPAEQLVYVVMLLRIYECNGPCPDTLAAIARRTGHNKRIVTEALDRLFRAERLHRVAEGIHNRKAERLLGEAHALRQERKVAGAEGGRRSAEKRKGKQATPPSNPSSKTKQGSTHLHLASKEDSLFPEVGNSGQPAVQPQEVPDARTELFRKGLDLFKRITGQTDRPARALIGRWLKDANEDAVLVCRTIEDAATNRIGDPVPWITAGIKSRTGGANGISRQGSRAGEKLRPGMLAANYRARSKA